MPRSSAERQAKMERVKSRLEELVREWWKPAAIIILSAALLFFNSASNAATQKRLEEVAFETHSALCTFVADLERRHADGQKFLERHPQGIEGITREDIKRSLEGQRSTLQSLGVLEC